MSESTTNYIFLKEEDGTVTSVGFYVDDSVTWDYLLTKFEQFLTAVGFVLPDFSRLDFVTEGNDYPHDMDVYDPNVKIDDNIFDANGNISWNDRDSEDLEEGDDEPYQSLAGIGPSARWPFE